jgi:hypothetical protein
MKLVVSLFLGLSAVIVSPWANANCTLIDRDIQLDGSFRTEGSVPFTPVDSSGKKFSASININRSDFRALAELTPTGVNLTVNAVNQTSITSFLKPNSLLLPPIIDLLDGFKARFSAEWEAEISCDYKN